MIINYKSKQFSFVKPTFYSIDEIVKAYINMMVLGKWR